MRAYPQFIVRIDGGDLVLRDGTRMKIATEPAGRNFDATLAKPDIAAMFSIPYPVGAHPQPPGMNDDPGRIRYEPLFRKMYGDCAKGEVTKRMTRVAWMPYTPAGWVR